MFIADVEFNNIGSICCMLGFCGRFQFVCRMILGFIQASLNLLL